MSEEAKSEAAAGSGLATHSGSCHCKAVQFQVKVDLGAGAARCNCSICTKVNQLGVIVKPEAFELLAGESELSTYEWGAKIGKRFFCKHCGIHCFGRGYLEQVGGAYVSVNVNALDDVDPSRVKTSYFDGRHNNWMAGVRNEPWPIDPTPA
jgi:hypothetical protein